MREQRKRERETSSADDGPWSAPGIDGEKKSKKRNDLFLDRLRTTGARACVQPASTTETGVGVGN